MYQNLKMVLPKSQRQDSVHYEMFPESRPEALNPRIEEAVARMQVSSFIQLVYWFNVRV